MKISKVILSLSLAVSFFLLNNKSIFAMELPTNEIVVKTEERMLKNGLTVRTTITQSNVDTYASTKSGSKKTEFLNGNTVLWYVKVNGTFSYNGSSATYTKSSVDAKAYDSAWKIASKSSSKSGNKASASATGKRYFLGLPVQTVNKTINLYCDKNGKLS